MFLVGTVVFARCIGDRKRMLRTVSWMRHTGWIWTRELLRTVRVGDRFLSIFVLVIYSINILYEITTDMQIASLDEFRCLLINIY